MLTKLITFLLIYLNLNNITANPIEIPKSKGLFVPQFQLLNSSNFLVSQGYNINEDEQYTIRERKKRFLEDLIYLYNFFANYDDDEEEDDSSSEEDDISNDDSFVSELCRNCSVTVNKIEQIQHIQHNVSPNNINTPAKTNTSTAVISKPIEKQQPVNIETLKEKVTPENPSKVETSAMEPLGATDAVVEVEIPAAVDSPAKSEAAANNLVESVVAKDALIAAQVPADNETPAAKLPAESPPLAENPYETTLNKDAKSEAKDKISAEADAIQEVPGEDKVPEEAVAPADAKPEAAVEGKVPEEAVAPAEAIPEAPVENKMAAEIKDKVPDGTVAPVDAIQEAPAEDKVPGEAEGPAEDKIPGEAEAISEAPVEDKISAEAKEKVPEETVAPTEGIQEAPPDDKVPDEAKAPAEAIQDAKNEDNDPVEAPAEPAPED